MNAHASIDRIVVINDYTVPEGGAGTLAMKSVELYRARGFAVTVLTGQGETDQTREAGADVAGLGKQGLLKTGKLEALRQGYHNEDAAELVTNWIAKNDTPRTVYHLHNWSQILSPSIFKPLQEVAARTIITCHDFFNICPNGSFVHYGKDELCGQKPLSRGCLAAQCDRRSSLHKYWRVARTRHFNQLANLQDARFTFTCIHDAARQKFLAEGFKGRDIRTVVNPAQPWSDTRIPAEDNNRLLFVGRVGPDKGADLALEAGQRAGMPVTIAGTGPEMETLKAQYPDAEFLGWCDRPMLTEAVAKARALIAPSRVLEPFGLAIMEAAMSGLPVFPSTTAYLAEGIESIGAGRAINTKDIAGMTAILSACANDDAATKNMSEAGAARGRELCNSYESWMDAFSSIFDEKLQKAPTA